MSNSQKGQMKEAQATELAPEILDNDAYIASQNAVIRGRIEKMQEFRETGRAVYATGFVPADRAAKLVATYGELDHDALVEKDTHVSVAGRIMAVRVFGKASFAVIKDGTGTIQLHVKRDVIGVDEYKAYKRFDVGDFVGATGVLFKTKTGELTVRCDTLELLTKSLRPLPEKWHGLTDAETRLRQRYVDLMVNDEVRAVFVQRSRIVQRLRELMVERGFLEVETPMMHAQAGGATARPFVTHHNALGLDLFLRVAPELYLKRLIVGGFERVFELNRNFRNEGLSRRHNPEFTMMEFYVAYGSYTMLMEMIEAMVIDLAATIANSDVLHWEGMEIKLAKPWRRLRIREGVAQALEIDEAELAKRETLIAHATRGQDALAPADAEKLSDGHLLMHLFETRVEASLIAPTFVYEFPASVSPLARRSEEDPDYVERFEVYMGGIEIGNAFNELNDPLDQRQRFLDQISAKLAGDLEAHPLDEDYVRALEYGMPPTAGAGIGIDRLVMLLTGASSIRDVILFPLLRPES